MVKQSHNSSAKAGLSLKGLILKNLGTVDSTSLSSAAAFVSDVKFG